MIFFSGQVKDQYDKATQEGLCDVSIEWQLFNNNDINDNYNYNNNNKNNNESSNSKNINNNPIQTNNKNNNNNNNNNNINNNKFQYQAPSNLGVLFNGTRLVVYGMVSDCTLVGGFDGWVDGWVDG